MYLTKYVQCWELHGVFLLISSQYSIVPLPLLQQKATQNCRYPRDKTPLTHVQG